MLFPMTLRISGEVPAEPSRACLDVDGRSLSFLDFGGSGRVLLALHGHFDEGRTFTRLAEELTPDWRVIALDQRGHGFSDRTADYSRGGYVDDAVRLLDHLGVGRAVVLGHSLGGVNAYQLAAREPHRVEALIIEDIGVELDHDLSFSLAWPRRAATRSGLIEGLGDSARYLMGAVREFPDGWGLAFSPEDMVRSGRQQVGDYWSDWLATDCPALLIQGTKSDILGSGEAKAMAQRRPGTRLAELTTGHTVHATDPAGFIDVVREFLESL
ncbi:esterase [Streptacidiphilus sp. MAP12-20]